VVLLDNHSIRLRASQKKSDQDPTSDILGPGLWISILLLWWNFISVEGGGKLWYMKELRCGLHYSPGFSIQLTAGNRQVLHSLKLQRMLFGPGYWFYVNQWTLGGVVLLSLRISRETLTAFLTSWGFSSHLFETPTFDSDHIKATATWGILLCFFLPYPGSSFLYFDRTVMFFSPCQHFQP